MSITVASAIATILLALAQVLNIQLKYTDSQLTQLIMAIATLVTGAISWYGRYRLGDITILGSRRPTNLTIDSLPDEPS